jgi:PAS domain S-box-containing protein
MRQALSGRSGTLVGPDYRGTDVLAAYEPVSILDLGIVAKIDLAEIRAPFLRAFGIIIAVAIALITLGTVLFYRVSNPMIRTIRESEERYRAVAEDTPVLICRFLPSSEIVYANEAYRRYFGETSEALVGSSFLSLIPEENRQTVLANIMALTPDSPTQSHELQVVASGGEIRWQRWTNRALFDARGQAVAYQAIGEDITERTRAEQALRRSETRLAEAHRLAHIGTWELDLQSYDLWWSDEVYRIFDVDPGSFTVSYQAFLDAVHPDDRDYVNRVYTESLSNGTPYDIVHRLYLPDGRIKYVTERCETFFAEDGKPARSIGTVQDITERLRHDAFTTHQTRRTEALLELPRAAEELGEIAFMQRGLEMAEELTESRISFVHFVNDDEQSIELVTWSRRTLGEYCSATAESHYPVHEAGIWADALRRYEAVVFNDYPGYVHQRGLPKGHAELTRLISLPVIENGKVVMLAGVGNKPTDYGDLDVETLQLIANAIWRIVQRRRSVTTLQANEARYRELVESMTDGVGVYEAVESGQDFVIREHNQAGERITEMPRNRVIGRRLTEVFPKVGALGLLDVLRRVWRTGEAESYPTSLYQDERISAWIESYVFKLPSGEVVAVYSDMTERKQAEEALHTSRERLRRLAARIEATREEERTAIAREVHDEFGQALTGLKMDLAWLRDHLAKVQTEAFAERLGAAEALADSTLDGMRRLAARLRPSLLDDLGLTAAIEWLVKEFAGRVGCRFDLDLTEDDIGFDRERDTAVYRILQEALTNVARHAQASQVTVSLEATSDTLELTVADNGKGIRDEDMEGVTSLGLMGMRERAEALGGQIDVRPGPGGGTRVLLRLPRSNGA